MRHRNGISKLGRDGQHRRSLMRNMAIALFDHERIVTTLGKARALRPFAERLITLARRGDLHARRCAGRAVHDPVILRKLFAELGVRFANRPGGYLRILKKENRVGDNAPMAIIELVDRVEPNKSLQATQGNKEGTAVAAAPEPGVDVAPTPA